MKSDVKCFVIITKKMLNSKVIMTLLIFFRIFKFYDNLNF